MITIAKLSPADRPRWEELFHGYNTFYESEYPQSMYDRAWAEFQADERMHAYGAWLDGELVGITHFFPHVQTTASDSVYLEDLFTAPEALDDFLAAARFIKLKIAQQRFGNGKMFQ